MMICRYRDCYDQNIMSSTRTHSPADDGYQDEDRQEDFSDADTEPEVDDIRNIFGV